MPSPEGPIRKRISSVKSTQIRSRAPMKIGGRCTSGAARRARIVALRPYAVKTQEILARGGGPAGSGRSGGSSPPRSRRQAESPACSPARPEKNVTLVVLTSDRGLCGGLQRQPPGKPGRASLGASARKFGTGTSSIYTIGRKGSRST